MISVSASASVPDVSVVVNGEVEAEAAATTPEMDAAEAKRKKKEEKKKLKQQAKAVETPEEKAERRRGKKEKKESKRAKIEGIHVSKETDLAVNIIDPPSIAAAAVVVDPIVISTEAEPADVKVEAGAAPAVDATIEAEVSTVDVSPAAEVTTEAAVAEVATVDVTPAEVTTEVEVATTDVTPPAAELTTEVEVAATDVTPPAAEVTTEVEIVAADVTPPAAEVTTEVEIAATDVTPPAVEVTTEVEVAATDVTPAEVTIEAEVATTDVTPEAKMTIEIGATALAEAFEITPAAGVEIEAEVATIDLDQAADVTIEAGADVSVNESYLPPVGENDTVETEECEEYIDGQLCKVRRTINTKTIVTEQIIPLTDVVVTKAPSVSEQSGTVSLKVDIETPEAEPSPPNLLCFCKTPSGKQAYGLLTNNNDGTFTVDINASEPGMHVIDILNDGKKVPGSPFLVNIIQAVDKKKVLLYGRGLQSGLLSEFEGSFHVDTTGAGPGDLNVRVNGPKKTFNVEMTRDANSTDRVVNVNYTPTVAGVYSIDVLWSGEHVEGSPVEVVLAADELKETDGILVSSAC